MRLLIYSSLLFLAQLSMAQDSHKQFLQLSYAEIDSLFMIPYQKGDFNTCILLMQAAREKAETEFGAQDSVYAVYTSNLGFFYQLIGKYEQSLSLFIDASKIIEKIQGKEHPDFAACINNIAAIHEMMGNYEAALPLSIEANQLDSKLLGEESSSFAVSLSNLAVLHEKMGNYHLALPLSIKAKDINAKVHGEAHPSFGTSMNNLALLYKKMGHYDLALPLFIRALRIREEALGKEHPDIATSLNNLATLHEKMGNYDLAIPLFIQANSIREKVLGQWHPDLGQSLQNLAALHINMNNYHLALPILTQANKIDEQTLGKGHPDFAISLNSLAQLHQRMGKLELALSLFKETKVIYEKTLGKEHPIFATALNNLAHTHQIMGNYTAAIPLYIEAKNIRENVLGRQHPEFIQSLNNLAGLYQKMGDFPKAWDYLRQSMNSSSSIEIEANFDRPWLERLKKAPYLSTQHILGMIQSLALAYVCLEKDPTIVSSLDKQVLVTDLANELLNLEKDRVTNEQDKLRMLAQSNDWLLKSLEVFNPEKDHDKAFLRADGNKSVLLLEATKSEAAYRLGEIPDSLIWKDKQLLTTQSQLQAKLIEKRPKEEKDSLRNKLNHVNQSINDFVARLAKEYPRYHQLKYSQQEVKVSDIQQMLNEQTALLEYVIGDSVVHIFYIDKEQIQWKKSFIDNKTLSNKIKTFHQALSNYSMLSKAKEKAFRAYSNQAHFFYKKLLAPILEDKQNIKNLIIVSDGELGHLPFETFLTKPPSQSLSTYNGLSYLVNDYNISYNFSATLWKENIQAPMPSNNGQILGLAANYAIQMDSSTIDLRLPTDLSVRKALSPLPNARKEVELLKKNYQGFFVFDSLASEKMVKKKASDYAILHFATHGILDPERPILSSLAFTEDNDSLESNFWQAYEISKMELNANLVVLSACETGFGKFEKGNGIASLARAFMYAGASSLIVSLWQVNDFATSKIMAHLYANLANGMKKDEALRYAKLEYIKTAKGIMAHPAFWSPFIQIGKTNPVSIATKGNKHWFWFGGTFFVLLLGGGFWGLRKWGKKRSRALS